LSFLTKLVIISLFSKGMDSSNMTTLLGYDEICLRHQTGNHPEQPERLVRIIGTLEQDGVWADLMEVAERVEADPWILAIHAQDYVDRLKRACRNQRRFIDCGDSAICAESYEVAREAVALTLGACEMILSDRAVNGFCPLRPPGHHAEYDRSMGFCLFNNIAIACRYLQKQHGLKRILILDWDVHHGNGSQHTFEKDDTVFYCSLHQHPRTCYPGTGWPDEKGQGPGRGYTLNLPLEPGAGDEECLEVFNNYFLNAASEFKPDFVLISAGFDGHRDDPLAQLNLSERAYEVMIEETKKVAQQYCQGRLLSLLEGGYNLEALSSCVLDHVKILSQEH